MCRLFNVTGRVQGVFFRVSTRDVASPLGLNGHSINLPDGSVEVRACGDDTAIDQLQAWLHEGPPHANVSAVNERLTACTAPARFNTG
ncbi:MAG: acylphosphatase [Woeseiaceae bacterium]|nr:acylphosphatase [Woeseiaceae bacterium]